MTTNCVLLGVADERILSGNADWATNKIGGFADFPHQVIVRPTCLRCGCPQLLVVQVYCPLENSKYHRTIYLFCCPNKTCWSENNGWMVLRIQSLEVKHKQEKTAKKDDFTWNDTDDDWGDENKSLDVDQKTDNNAEEEFLPSMTSNFTHLSLESEGASGKSQSQTHGDQEPCFPSFYINVFNEHELEEYDANGDNYIKTLRDEYEAECETIQDNHHGIEGLSMGSSEPYERSDEKGKNFHRFRKKVELCREQVLRYNHLGVPLLLSEAELPSVGNCAHCGRKLVFEFQLMPGLIPYLESGNKEEDCIEFGTVLVYTCSQSCWNDDTNKPVPECVLYLPDPDLKFFKTQKT
uniref:Programmed cell death protein 2-like n=1 Tax=Phallusia mammillata TaxID=59560 RepID=A0A6F9DMP7_9ASCI|nr:programmed cell death protein 2-like [Phallusia mammillata]